MDDREKIKARLQELLKPEPQNFYDLSLQAYQDFDKTAHEQGEGYSCPDFPFFNQKMEGLLPGLYLIAAKSNTGKTAFMTNLMWSYCTHEENHLFGIYYSLDDSKNEVIPRLMSMLQQIPISVCSKPRRYMNAIEVMKHTDKDNPLIGEYEEYLVKREQALRQLEAQKEHFLVVDTDTVSGFEALVEHAHQVRQFVKEQDPRNDIMICIDAISDLQYTKKRFSSSDEKYRQISMDLKWLAKDFPVFGSAHLRKLNDKKRPTLDDLKDTNRLQYDASVVWLLHNDVSENKQNAAIFYGQSPDVQPIIEVDWSKNKKSSYKGRSFCYFAPNFSLTRECTEEDRKRYESLLYTN